MVYENLQFISAELPVSKAVIDRPDFSIHRNYIWALQDASFDPPYIHVINENGEKASFPCDEYVDIVPILINSR